MLTLLRAMIDRVKAMLLATAAREIEEDVLMRQAKIHGGLRQLANQYDADKQPKVADELRRQLDSSGGQGELADDDGAALTASGTSTNGHSRRIKGR